MTALRIRSAEPADIDQLLAIEATRFATDRLSRRSLRHLIAAPSVAVLVAAHQRRILGYAIVLFRRGLTIARLYSLAVAADVTRRGIAAALLAACEKTARLRGCRALRLEVHADNAAARALYAKSGYCEIARLPAYYAEGGAGLRLEKPIAAAPAFSMRRTTLKADV